MNVSDLLTALADLGIQLRADGEQLVIQARKGSLTAALQDQLRSHKAELISMLRQRSEASRGEQQLEVIARPQERHQPFPMTDMQQAYWVGRSSAFEMGGVACQLYFESDSADLDLARLAQSWQRLIDRHDMLRAIVGPDALLRVLAEVPRYEIAVTDLSEHSAERAAEALTARRAEMSHKVAPTDQWPLFELRASRLAAGTIRLHFRIEVLIADGRSIFNLFREWGQLYRDPNHELPALELHYRDYVVAEQAYRSSEAYRRSERYWTDRLATLPPAPDLPLAPRLDPGAQQRFVRRSFILDAQRWTRLCEHGRELGLTRSSLMAAAYAEVLRSWSKNPDFCLNVTVLNRPPVHPQIDQIVGDFTITLLLAASGAGSTFEHRATALHRQMTSDLEHGGFSAVRVLRELARQRGSKRAALMPIIFTSPLGARLEDSTVTNFLGTLVYCITQTPQLWLDHQVSERDGELVVTWDAIDANFAPGVLDDMFAAYQQLLHRLADDSAAWQSETRRTVPQPQLDRRAQVNATAATLSPTLLHQPFLLRAAKSPHHPAIICGAVTLTYGELRTLSCQLAHRLRAAGVAGIAGVATHQLVAVVMEKGWQQVVAVLAILQAGAAYLPIDPATPTERLHHLLAHGEVALALTQSTLRDVLIWPAQVTPLLVDRAELAGESTVPLSNQSSWEDLAYVLYTSGSTGLPKGVMIDHRGAINTILDLNARFHIGPDDRVLGLSALSFDLSVYDLFGTLAAGATLVLPDAGGMREPGHWAEMMRRHRITLWNSVPALMQMLVEYLEGRGEPLANSLRLVWLSGDWIAVELPARIRALRSDIELISMGGATEASIWSILYPIADVDPEWTSIPYGRPMQNQTFHVLDDRLEPCPDWVTGQLYIGGLGVARGYWRDLERSQEAFSIDAASGERRYRTGDLGRYLPDGSIEFLGREDSQVKIRGHRIELGEIESALRSYPQVRAAVVAAVGKERSQRRLVAYLVAEPAGEAPSLPTRIEFEPLRAFLAGKLPEYMIPSSLVLLDELPMSANGKCDRKALPAPELDRGEQDASYVAPQTALQQTIAAVWSEVLTLPRVGIRDTFFDLGGDSVMMVSVHRRLSQQLERELTVVELFQFPTVETLANHLDQAAIEHDSSAARQDRASRRHHSADERRSARQQRVAGAQVDTGEGKS
jgi:pyochelin synthetase